MDTILSTKTTSISTFKSNPNAALEMAGNEPFAVLTNNKPSFYVMRPEVFESIAELLFEIQMTPTLRKRLSKVERAIAVKLEEL